MDTAQKRFIIDKLSYFITQYCIKNRLSAHHIERRGYDAMAIDFDNLNEFETARLKLLGNQEAYLIQYHPDYWFAVNIIVRLVRADHELQTLNWAPVKPEDLQKVNELYDKLIEGF